MHDLPLSVGTDMKCFGCLIVQKELVTMDLGQCKQSLNSFKAEAKSCDFVNHR